MVHSAGVVVPIEILVARVITRALAAVFTATPLNRVEQQARVVPTNLLLARRVQLLLTVLKLLWILKLSVLI
jgi:hypothetical protein